MKVKKLVESVIRDKIRDIIEHSTLCLHLIILSQEMKFLSFKLLKCLVILNYFVWLRITDEGSVPVMRIWSVSEINSD